MCEEHLTYELHRVGDRLEVPPDLYPARRIALAARPWWRRPATMGVAGAAALAVVVGLTPAGQRTVLAATGSATATFRQWLTRSTSERMTVKLMDDQTLAFAPLGGSRPGTPVFVRIGDAEVMGMATQRELTVAELKEQLSHVPLPLYLPPADSERVELRTYPTAQNGQWVEETRLSLDYAVPDQGSISLRMQFRARGSSESKPVEVERAVEAGESQVVTVGGRPALAFTNGVHWTLTWTAPSGRMELFGNLPLEELIKVAESIPDSAP